MTVGGAGAAALMSTAAVRERCRNVAVAVARGRSRSWDVHYDKLEAAADRVVSVTRRRYPDLNIPYHSRWRHFQAGRVDRIAELERELRHRNAAEAARARIDLVVVSVLLDAGAGAAWSYTEHTTGRTFTRSEGLGVATFRAFMAGAFSSQRSDPLRVDAAALSALDAAKLARWMQASDSNPLVGLEGRAALLQRLGRTLEANRAVFTSGARPGALFDHVQATADAGTVRASALLASLLSGLGGIWLTGSALDGVPLGDAWRHPFAGGEGASAGWVPFHKLSQWLAYSLLEPFEWAGIEVIARDELTALPEYRNGGLLVDAGVLALKDPAAAGVEHGVGSEIIVEWRALTVTLIDEIAPLVRSRLKREGLPLACILEGGTWAAGRELAQALRGGDPPLKVRSDGTVF